mmetsp:Transcript_41671/g.98823  ORF Transcript_41671/g.98823 Transcript_41671/m.98823 type:complete len:213 (-) Transcript_41671:3138-3776(-)
MPRSCRSSAERSPYVSRRSSPTRSSKPTTRYSRSRSPLPRWASLPHASRPGVQLSASQSCCTRHDAGADPSPSHTWMLPPPSCAASCDPSGDHNKPSTCSDSAVRVATISGASGCLTSYTFTVPPRDETARRPTVDTANSLAGGEPTITAAGRTSGWPLLFHATDHTRTGPCSCAVASTWVPAAIPLLHLTVGTQAEAQGPQRSRRQSTDEC